MFSKRIALITFAHDTITEGYAIVEKPVLRSIAGHQIIEAVHASRMAKYLRKKRILIPLCNVTSITEFDRVSDIQIEDEEAGTKKT